MPTFRSKPRYSASRKAAIKRGLERSWREGAHHKRFHCQPVDADTVRKRELWGRKGAHIEDFRCVRIAHSKRRTDSYDVFSAGGELVCSGGRAKVGLYLGSLLP